MEKDTIEALERLFTLKERGAIDDAEYVRLKDELLAPKEISIVLEDSPSTPSVSSDGPTEVRFWCPPKGKIIAVIKEVRTLTNLGLKEAKEIVDSASADSPYVIVLERDAALAFASKLESRGAIVELIPPNNNDGELLQSDFRSTVHEAQTSVAPSQARAKSGTPEWLKSDREKIKEANTGLICPHCQIRGKISRKEIKKKKGISASKLMAAPVTGGTSLFVVGLSRKDTYTQLTCGACKMVWVVES